MADTCSCPGTDVYRLRVVIAGISPLIWRRLEVADATTVAGLHAIVQAVFGWSGEHLHRFVIGGTEYGISCPGGPGFRDDARQVRFADLGLREGERFALRVQLIRRLGRRPARRADCLRRAGAALSAVHGRAPRGPARGLGRAVGFPGADPAAPGVRRDRTRRGDHRPAARCRRTSRPGRRRRGPRGAGRLDAAAGPGAFRPPGLQSGSPRPCRGRADRR